MLSVASLLNPIKSEPRGQRLPSSPSPSFCTMTSSHDSPPLSAHSSSSLKKSKMTKDGAVFAKGKIKGEVNYPPFERLDEIAMRELRKFEAYPLGKIREYPRHIPYNSEKKSFLEKTGRECFEVFQYIFKVPGDDRVYTVMWDYNIGLVRITPFFKCLKHTKTMPAKMLNMNPGLKDITHSITGGALVAQGYWMPYTCALAICTTFCAPIAPALIPLFGPSFPSLCVSLEAPEHGRMIIDSAIISAATQQAESYRMQYSSTASPSFPTPKSSTTGCSASPELPEQHVMRDRAETGASRRLRLKRGWKESRGDRECSETSGSEYFYSPGPASRSWPPHQPHSQTHPPPHHQYPRHQAQNLLSRSANSGISIANPWLSAIPRSTGIFESPLQIPSAGLADASAWRKRRLQDEGEADDEYESASLGSEKSEHAARTGRSPENRTTDQDTPMTGIHAHSEPAAGAGEEKRAAWLLMKLSVKDGEAAETDDGPRIKRRRATSV
ncbi:hypothetical protein B0O99DRAFT_715912 [Bisporella sp. PMI_857]|nr:hypothetical protein B0O99DRAFT_715912 [Bisporella sp. PMI_857]